MKQTGIFEGHAEVLYNYGRFGWTRNYGKTWHGGIDIVGLDSDQQQLSATERLRLLLGKAGGHGHAGTHRDEPRR